jgi:hypothetical protein
LLVVAVLSFMVLTLSECIEKSQVAIDLRGQAYAGAAACAGCHKGIHETYIQTAHNWSSRPASRQTVKGSFHKDSNTYFYSRQVKVVMEKRDSGLYQVAYDNDIEKQATRFDIVIGSGRKAQTYLYWFDDKVYQLPVSYFLPVQSWVNSPGYPPGQVRFDRNIPIGCFECHSSHISLTGNEVSASYIINKFDRSKIIYGIDCERCHGPAAKHADFHQQHPAEKKANYIVAYANLSREQKIDMCAVCHSGIQQTIKSSFKFRPGERLVNNYFTETEKQDVNKMDVHGNQTQLLMASACYIKSKSLTCSSCHNTHVKERDNLALFSQRCMNCHTNVNHDASKLPQGSKNNLINNCIDCHMPAIPSKAITLLSNGKATPTPDMIRTHLIKVYPRVKS